VLRGTLGAAIVALALAAARPVSAEAPLGIAIVTRDQVPLRAAPRDSAQTHALLWQGEALEVRAVRTEYLQVYDHRRERGGFVRASQVRRTMLDAAEAPDLLAIVRFLHDAPGAEALGIGFAAAYIGAASREAMNDERGIEALDALGTFADRLAHRASLANPKSKATQAALSAHLEVAARYGIHFASHELDGRMQVCYEGDAFRRVLALPSSAEQRARAALALTRQECVAAEMRPADRHLMDEWRAGVLDRVDAAALPAWLRNRVLMRRAGVWASLAYQRARKGEAADAAAGRALAELAGVVKNELAEEDAPIYNDAAMRVGASRWAASAMPAVVDEKRPHILIAEGKAGETCVLLVDAKSDRRRPLARRCTYGLVWSASAALNREGTALALAVQPAEAWREIWVFRKSASGWTLGILPPAATLPGIGYAEFSGWVPGGARMLVAREARGEGKYRRRFEVVRLDTLATQQQASDPGVLRAFQRWQDPAWKRQTVSVR